MRANPNNSEKKRKEIKLSLMVTPRSKGPTGGRVAPLVSCVPQALLAQRIKQTRPISYSEINTRSGFSPLLFSLGISAKEDSKGWRAPGLCRSTAMNCETCHLNELVRSNPILPRPLLPYPNLFVHVSEYGLVGCVVLGAGASGDQRCAAM